MSLSDYSYSQNCERVLVCMYSSCCTAQIFQKELIISYIVIFAIATFLVFFFTIVIHKKVNKGEKRNTFHNFFMLFKNLSISIFTTTLIMLKIFETSWFRNILYVGTIDLDEIKHLSAIVIQHSYIIYLKLRIKHEIFLNNIVELSVLFMSFIIFQLNGDYVENHKKQMMVLVMYSYQLADHLFPSKYASSILLAVNGFFVFTYSLMIVINLILLNYSYNVFETKKSLEKNPEEVANQNILEQFAKYVGQNIDSEEDLLNKTEKLLKMKKSLEIVSKIRKSRKRILNVGTFFLFIIIIIVLVYNAKNHFRNMDFLYLNNNPAFSNMDNNELSNVVRNAKFDTTDLYLSVIKKRIKEKNYPKSLVIMLASGVTSDSLLTHPDFKAIYEKIAVEDKDGRLYNIQVDNNNKFNDWFSYLTGGNRRLTGMNSNIIEEGLNYDSIFNRAFDNKILNYVITSPTISPFLKAMFPQAKIINDINVGDEYNIDKEYFDFVASKDAKNTIELGDEVNFQKLLRYVRENEKRRKGYIDLIETEQTQEAMYNAYKSLPHSISTLTLLHLNTVNSLNNEYVPSTHPRYLGALTIYAEYLKIIYEEISQDTILCFLSDTVIGASSAKRFIPAFFARKHSSFADPKMTLFSDGINKQYDPKDLAPTFAALLNIEPPSGNIGKAMDEVMQLNDGTIDEKKLFYYKLRVQKQELFKKMIGQINQPIIAEEAISQDPRPVETSTSEFYYDEIESFAKSYSNAQSTLFKHQAPKNLVISLFLGLLVMFSTILVMQKLTFADPLKLFRKTIKGEMNLNTKCFLLALSAQGIYYVVCWGLSILYYINNLNEPFVDTFENNYFIADYIIMRIILPGMVALNIQKNYFVNIFYSDKIKYWWMKYFYSIEYSVLSDSGMAEIYLFRLYNHFLSIFISMVLLFLYADVAFPFTRDVYINHLIYTEQNFVSLKTWNTYLSLTCIYMFIGLSDFYNYPKFSGIKQIWDSLFLLHDEKVKEFDGFNGKLTDYTIEDKLFNSEFVKDTFNSDYQSEFYHTKVMEGEKSLMVEKVFNQSVEVTATETDAILEDVVMGRDDDNDMKLKLTLMKPIN